MLCKVDSLLLFLDITIIFMVFVKFRGKQMTAKQKKLQTVNNLELSYSQKEEENFSECEITNLVLR